jgi:hypothetical protein
VGRPKGRRPFGRPRYRWDNNIKWILKKWDGAWTGLIWLRIGTGGGSCDCGNEPSGAIKYVEFFD